MRQRGSFYRKMAYIGAIVVLLFPLAWLSKPAITARAAPDGKGTPGGKLSQLRDEYKLGQANLGEIDATSETFRLATLGMRGIAANLLWEKANYYKKVEDWTSLSATLEQIARLQPNFISVWRHQAWNLSYNVSVEFDDYHDRYYYVIRGIDFLKEGIKYNEGHPDLLSDLGWFIGQKIGRADEHVQFRRLFREDDDFHPPERPPGSASRDNWLVAHEWYRKAEDSVLGGTPLKRPDGRGKSELLFYSAKPMTLMNYSEAIEDEGAFDDTTRNAWKRAGDEWAAYGSMEIPYSTHEMEFRLGELEQVKKTVEEHRQALDALVPGLWDTMRQERKAALPADQREALDTPVKERTSDQHGLAAQAKRATEVTPRELAERIAKEHPDKGAEARRLASALENAQLRARYIENYRGIVNFDYWRTRAKFEQTPEALKAHALVHEARQAHEAGDLNLAKKKYDEGLAEWRIVLDRFPVVKEDTTTTGPDLIEVAKRYRKLMRERDEPFPMDFPLWDILELHDTQGDFKEELAAYHASQKGKPSQSDEKDKGPSKDSKPSKETSNGEK